MLSTPQLLILLFKSKFKNVHYHSHETDSAFDEIPALAPLPEPPKQTKPIAGGQIDLLGDDIISCTLTLLI